MQASPTEGGSIWSSIVCRGEAAASAWLRRSGIPGGWALADGVEGLCVWKRNRPLL